MTAATRPPLALDLKGAAAALGLSYKTFRAHVLPQLRVVKTGRRYLVSVRELEAWLDRSAAQLLPEELPLP